MSTRKVTVHNTVGSNNKSFTSSAQTWGQLKRDMDANRVPYQGFKAVLGNTQVTLESEEAQLLDEDIIIFLVQPTKVKSGYLVD